MLRNTHILARVRGLAKFTPCLVAALLIAGWNTTLAENTAPEIANAAIPDVPSEPPSTHDTPKTEESVSPEDAAAEAKKQNRGWDPPPVNHSPTPASPTPPKEAVEPVRPKSKTTIIDLQSYLFSQNATFKNQAGEEGSVELINLNEKINMWFILKVTWPKDKTTTQYHIENAYPESQRLGLSANFPNGIIISKIDKDNKAEQNCPLWASESQSPLREASAKSQPHVLLCDGKLFLRNKIEGYRTLKEWAVEFLRDNVWGGETITTMVKETIYKDKYLISADDGDKEPSTGHFRGQHFPQDAKVDREFSGVLLEPKELGLTVDNRDNSENKMFSGRWYELKGRQGIFVSMMAPEHIDRDILEANKKTTGSIDSIEAKAISYATAFDLNQYKVHFVVGTEHPRVDWSERALDKVRTKQPGPDGIGTIDPIIATGIVNPLEAKRIISTFTGGFKRSHGAFRWGSLATKNFGSHYGFIESGVVFSKLQEDLATIAVLKDDRVIMKTWKAEDNVMLPDIKFARQNGVPILETDPTTNLPKPGDLVSNWTLGNWSGSQEMKFRTLRAGLCLATKGESQFLIYAYFSSATPVAMAKVFAAYGCQYAMHLDMNALEHTYLAIYLPNSHGELFPYHLITGMAVLDQRLKGNIPRFVGYPDNRDFFYLTTKEGH
ncbi:MAG: hypothetical protein AB7T49_12295 [Oligoflexales bacterium]